MSHTSAQSETSAYDESLVDEWHQLQESDTPNGPLRPSSGKPIPNNAGFSL